MPGTYAIRQYRRPGVRVWEAGKMRRLWPAVCAVVLAAAALIPAIGAGAANGHASYRAVCPTAEQAAARCNSQVVTDERGNPQASTGPVGYGPLQFQGAYGVAGLTSSQTVAIVDAYDDPQAE